MNLPFILDVVIGLIFIYLMLSLLASEIQELIATVFQWRAEHLKKSIEILLAGDVDSAEEAHVIQLANRIYDNPLVKNINQEAKGLFVTIPRKITWAIGSLYRMVKKPRPGTDKSTSIFGGKKHTGPSYIPADVFATTLVETLQIPALVQKLTESRLKKFKEERLAEIEEIIIKLQEQTSGDESLASFFSNIYKEFAELRSEFEKTCWNFHQKKASLQTSLNRMAESFDRYIESFQAEMPENELCGKALRRLKFWKKDIFDDIEQAILLGGLQPNINEVVQTIDQSSDIYKEIKAAIQDQDSETHQGVKKAFQTIETTAIENLPPSVVQNLAVLAKRAQARVKTTEEGMNALRLEIENTFDSSMERASGVYKRNAKGAAILIGLAIAITANADAIHMISRLSKDSALRDTITNSAGEIVLRNSTVDLDQLRQEADEVLTNISLPIGWSDANLEQQIKWTRQSKTTFPYLKILALIPGWLLSGIAIAMGAPFWFDLLSKIVNVRNAGKRPDSYARNVDEKEEE
ncbi:MULTISPECIES: hypothetical protein [Fischerella]|uniref:Uncharacterized protein n=1 Tax=Fischerella muscicola CCMEE 5323 TaxID=2019572 RepID=A0A2N6JUY9_FISMU|nr:MULTISPECIES: hypothetical protein [Fischerella]MBD2433428.1 hypothetical protein [Fischerella sp. FACHB-380]PLZ82377.1 hypothetical protein CEN44_27805 [Fischerella muscicola CCMEE 5323]